MRRIFLLVLMASFVLMPAAHAAVVDFEDLTPTIAYGGPGGGAYENGPNMTNIGSSPGAFGGTDLHNQFSSGGATFNNTWNDPGGFWSGWSYSNTTDTSTAGFTNQYSAITGGGAGGSSNYGVAYAGSPPIISFANPVTVIDGYFTNTTYAYLSMLNGDGFVDAFQDGDWQDLIIEGFDSSGSTGTVTVNLADYRNGGSFILATWLGVDLTSLGAVSSLEFSFDGSQPFVPSYVAMDNLNTVPIPGAVWLLGSGLVGVVALRRRGAKK